MTGVYYRVIRQRHESCLNTVYQLAAAAPRHHGSADAAPEESVPGKYLVPVEQADAAGRMPGGV
jgi:hypothetical protein